MPTDRRLLHLYVTLPVALFAFPHLFLWLGGYRTWVLPVEGRELGLVENATAAFFLIAAAHAFYLLATRRGSAPWGARLGLGVVGTASLWVALEEISYGQHWFGFESPPWFVRANNQQQLNLHNLAGDRPANLLRTLGYVLVAGLGVLAPLAVARRRTPLPTWSRCWIPPRWMIAPSLLQLFCNAPKQLLYTPRGREHLPPDSYFRLSVEYEEYLFGVWMMLFVYSVHRNLREAARTAPPGHTYARRTATH